MFCSTVRGTDWHVQLSTTSCKLISRSMRRAAPLSSNTIYQYKYNLQIQIQIQYREPPLVLKWSDLLWIARCTSLLTFIWLLTNPICFVWPDCCSRSCCSWICDKVNALNSFEGWGLKTIKSLFLGHPVVFSIMWCRKVVCIHVISICRWVIRPAIHACFCAKVDM